MSLSHPGYKRQWKWYSSTFLDVHFASAPLHIEKPYPCPLSYIYHERYLSGKAMKGSLIFGATRHCIGLGFFLLPLLTIKAWLICHPFGICKLFGQIISVCSICHSISSLDCVQGYLLCLEKFGVASSGECSTPRPYLGFQRGASNINNLLKMDLEREGMVRPSWSENCQQATPSH